MKARTTNLLGIIITILAGTYFFIMYCDACQTDEDTLAPSQARVESLD